MNFLWHCVGNHILSSWYLVRVSCYVWYKCLCCVNVHVFFWNGWQLPFMKSFVISYGFLGARKGISIVLNNIRSHDPSILERKKEKNSAWVTPWRHLCYLFHAVAFMKLKQLWAMQNEEIVLALNGFWLHFNTKETLSENKTIVLIMFGLWIFVAILD